MRQFNRKHDTILFYSKGNGWIFNGDQVRIGHHPKTQANYREGLTGSGHADTPLRTGKIPESWWAEEKGNGLSIVAKQKKQYVGYPTQKPLALLERIIKASSNEGDVVLDPFCGCATTCVAAQHLQRQWIGIDISEKAAELVMDRLSDEGGLFTDFVHLDRPPQRTDLEQCAPDQDTKTRLYTDQQGQCNACGVEMEIRHLEIDHIIPRAKHGGDYYENYQLLCGHCNRVKGDRTMEYLRVKLKRMNETLKTRVSF